MFQDLKHVAYPVRDLGKAKEWYSRLLETEPAVDSPFAVVFRVGDSSLSLFCVDHASHASGVIAYWAVDDVDRVYQELLHSGAAPRMEVNTVFGIRRAAISDPFGNTIGIIGSVAGSGERDSRLVEHRPSQTAQSVATLRALAATDPRTEIRGHDGLAELFLTDDQKKPLHEPLVRDWVMKNNIPVGLYEYLLCRTAYFDRVVKQSLQESIPQIVFLGAGYDTRPYRFRPLAGNTKIVELDAPPTQNRKMEILKRRNVRIPEGLVYVPINLQKDDLGEALRAADFDWSKKTLFVLEGVIYYLTLEVVERTLACIRTNARSGSIVCLDLKCRLSEGTDAAELGRAREMFRAHHPGEPILFEIDSERVVPFLSQWGFKIEEDLTAADMERMFLTLQDGSLAGKVPACFRIITASI
jgi:methyltransferase (TIGR00027 family)